MSDHGLPQGDSPVIRRHKAMGVNLETGLFETMEYQFKKEGILEHPAAQDNPIQTAFQPDSPARFYHNPSNGSMKLS
jgi:hypothetical protein